MNRLNLSKLFFIVSLFLIISTIIIALTLSKFLHELCVCTSNKLAYSWIFLALTALVSALHLLLAAGNKNVLSRKTERFFTALSVAQYVLFFTGLVWLIVFACRVLDVI